MTDPQKADTIFTDKIGEGLEQKLQDWPVKGMRPDDVNRRADQIVERLKQDLHWKHK